MPQPFSYRARVIMHLNGGYSQIVLEDAPGSWGAEGGLIKEIETHRIPPPLRGIGTRFVVRGIHRSSREAGSGEEVGLVIQSFSPLTSQ